MAKPTRTWSRKKKPPTGADADLNMATLSRLFTDENAAREFIERKRWPDDPYCPHCGCITVYRLEAKPGSKSPVRPGVYKCKACRKQFSVRIGTIFEESKIPLRKWLMAIHLMTSSKKGVSSHQIARELGVTVKSAWFVTHRIREAMKVDPAPGMLNGTVQVDEAYIGGKPRPKNNPDGTRVPAKRGRGTSKKPVVALVEWGGKVHSRPVDSTDSKTLKGAIRECVDPSATIHTDEYISYKGIGREFAGGHHTVNHAHKEYVRRQGDTDLIVTINEAESYFALLKRGHYGIFHQLPKRHLHRYCHEFSFRWCHRDVSDGERMAAAIIGAEGKRLRYA